MGTKNRSGGGAKANVGTKMMNKLRRFLFHHTSTSQTIIKNTFWLSASQLIRKIIKLAITVYAARILGVEGYGIFAYAVGLAGFFTIFSDIGISGLLIRNSSAENEIKPEHISTSLYIKLTLLGLSALLIFYVAPFFSNIQEAIPLLSVIALLILLDGLRDFSVTILRINERMELEAAIDTFTNIVTLALGTFAILAYRSPLSLAIAFTVASGFGLALSSLLLRKYLSGIWSHFNKQLARKLLADAWPFAITILFGAVMMNTDILMLGWLKGATAVGLYSAAIKPVQAIYLISGILAISTLPKISKFARQNSEKVGALVEKSISSLLLIGIPLTIGGLVVGEEIIAALYGADYLGAVLTFQIILLTVLVAFPMSMMSNLILSYDMQRKFLAPLATAAASDVVLNAMLIPKFDIVGAAITTLVTQALAITIAIRMMKKVSPFTIFPHLKKILLATIIMATLTITMKLFSFNFAINIVVSASIYFTLLKILKEPLLRQIRAGVK